MKTTHNTDNANTTENITTHTKKNIPASVRNAVWNKYISQHDKIAPCFCCGCQLIDSNNFCCGHVISKHNGGSTTIDNLRPICTSCNNSMGTQHMFEFMKQYGIPVINPIPNTLIGCSLISALSNPVFYKYIFDSFFASSRFTATNLPIICSAINNIFCCAETDAISVFDHFYSKIPEYNSNNSQSTFRSLVFNNISAHITSLFRFAIEDSKHKFINFINKFPFELEQHDICKYAKLLASNKFISTTNNNLCTLYCFNGKNWESNVATFKNFLSNELFDFLKFILVELYFDHPSFNKCMSKILLLKSTPFKQFIVQNYMEIAINNNIKFDHNPFLLGFNNIIFDLESNSFREYKLDDYVSITTGYDWQNPTDLELNTINSLILQIMPVPEERNLYLQLLSSSLNGKCLEHCILFNGIGSNGKSLIDDILLLALGNHALVGNNAILFERSKTGSNPEKANIHKKRLVVFREPPTKYKFSNSVIKELSGGGTFSARGHHESITQKELNLTMVIECNNKPLFAEEPTGADARRIIDLHFKTVFTINPSLVNPNNNIFLANPSYKNISFQESHKFALLHILMIEHAKFKLNNFLPQIPNSVINRTNSYLDLSCKFVPWFKDNYSFTGKNSDFCRITDVYKNLVYSPYFSALTKSDKRKYTKTFFVDYVSNNIFFKNFYSARYNSIRNIIHQWTPNVSDDQCNDVIIDCNLNNIPINIS